MKNFQYYNQSSKIDISDILNIEKQFNLKIPHQYVNFLLYQFGGILIDTYIKLIDGKGIGISCFYPLLSSESYQESTIDNSYPFDNLLWLLPFADDNADALFCFSIREIDYGQVYMIDYSMDSPPLLLSDSFNSFIEGLEKAGWDYEDIWTK